MFPGESMLQADRLLVHPFIHRHPFLSSMRIDNSTWWDGAGWNGGLGNRRPCHDSSPFGPIAWSAENLQVLRATAAAHGDGNDMVELQICGRTARATATSVADKDELPDVFRNRFATRRTRQLAHGDYRSRTFHGRLLALHPRHQERVHLVSRMAVVVPVVAILESPICALTDLA